MALFAFLYDDEAPGPLAVIGDAVSSTCSKAAKAVGEALDTETGKKVKDAAGVGLVVGAGVGVAVLVIGTASGIVNSIFSRN